MSMIFISHSSRDNEPAKAVRDWLAAQGWADVFLDLDPSAGLAPGQHWREELRKAGEHCSAVIVLVSPQWAASKWCLTEFLFAAQLGKEIFPVLISPCPLEELPLELTATYQFADISTPERQADGYERLRIGLYRAGLHPGAFPWPPKGEPKRPLYRGLKVLEEQDAAIFFGRDTQITKALDTVRRLRDGAPERMLVILGASGAGKSSFLRAGLLARLKRDRERFLVLPTVRPGRAALSGASGLQHALGIADSLDLLAIPDCLAGLRAPVLDHLRAHAPHVVSDRGPLPPTLVLPIDQAEELFVAGDAEAAAAIELIAELVKADSNLILLLTIRSDSFGLLQGDPHLTGIPRLPFDLPRLPTASLKEIIEGPTKLPTADIRIDPDLTNQLILDFEGPDGLPLLAFTLERLMSGHGTGGLLEKREYVETMKGVGGAIRQAVEIAFAHAAEKPGLPHERAALDELARRCFVPGLVRVDDIAGVPKRKVALRSELPQEGLPLIDCLADQRLLVIDKEGEEATVEVSHEAVLRDWRELADWIAERRDELRLCERIIAAAAEWSAEDGPAKAAALVHRGERLQAAEELLAWDELGWKTNETIQFEYLRACREAEALAEKRELERLRRQRLLRRRITGLVAVVAVVTVLGAVLVVAGQRNLSRAQSLTLARTAEQFAEKGDYLRALRLSILAARHNGLMTASAEGDAALSSNAQALWLKVEIRGGKEGFDGAVFSADQRRILSWSDDSTARLWDVATGAQVGPALKHEDEGRFSAISGAIFSADQRRILTWSQYGTARLWDVATGAQVGPALKHGDEDRVSAVSGVIFSADQRRILTWSEDGTAKLWDVATGAQVGPSPMSDNSVSGAVFSADQRRILTWGQHRTARLWDATTGAPVSQALEHDGKVLGAVFSADQRRILTWSEDGTARLWDVAMGAQVGPALKHEDEGRVSAVSGAMFSADQRSILTWSKDAVRQWDATTGAQIGRALKHDGEVLGAMFSADQRRILSWSWDRTARLWDATMDEQIGPELKHEDSVSGALFLADQRRILTWSKDAVRLWDAKMGKQISPALKHDGEVLRVALSVDQRRILTWSKGGIARLWDAATGGQIAPALDEGWVQGAVFSADQRRLLTWSLNDGMARLRDASTGAPIGPVLKHIGEVRGAVFSADQRRLLSWSSDGTARLWDATTGAQVGLALKHDGEVLGAVFSLDQRRILTWSEDHMARQWDATTGAQIGPALKHEVIVSGAVFSADQGRILTWSGYSTAWLWDAATGAPINPGLEHEGWVLGAVFSADQRRILTWSNDRTARLWDATTGAQVGGLKHDRDVLGAVFSADQRRILTWSKDDTVRLWEAATGEQIGPALKHDLSVLGAVFSADQRRILTWSKDGTARLWDVATGAQIGPELKHNGAVWKAVLSADQRRILTWSEDGRVWQWDLQWALRNPKDPDFVIDVCREKLVDSTVNIPSASSATEVLVGVRRIDKLETAAAPILRGREGEDVCAQPPTTWDTLVSLLSLRAR
jgi:WD40 repeat protein